MPFVPNKVVMWCSTGCTDVRHNDATISVLPWTIASVTSRKTGEALNANRWQFAVAQYGNEVSGKLNLLPAPMPLSPADEALNKIIGCGGGVAILVTFNGVRQEYLYVTLYP